MIRTYNRKTIKSAAQAVTETKLETRDAILWDVLPLQRKARVKIQGSNKLISVNFPRNWEETPFWLKPGNSVKITHTNGMRGRIEIQGHGLTVPTPVSGPTFPALQALIDAILTRLRCTPIPNNPQMAVMITTGTARIGGATITVPEIDMDVATVFKMDMGGLMGDVAEVLAVDVAPASGNFRIDLIVVGTDAVIDYIAGTESASPVKPAIPSSHVQICTLLVSASTTKIEFANINKPFRTRRVASIKMVIADDELAWAELSTAITVQVFDQYNEPFGLAGDGWYITLEFVSGNGTLSSVEEGSSTTKIGQHAGDDSFDAGFTYTRDQQDPGDVSPVIKATLEKNFPITWQDTIILLDASGSPMF